MPPKYIIIVILAAEAKFSITANSKKVSTNKFDIDGQPKIWPPKQEVFIFPKV